MSPCWERYPGDQNYLVGLAQLSIIGYFIDYLGHDERRSAKTLGLYNSYLRQLLDYFVKKVSTEYINPYWYNCNQQVIVSYFRHLKEKGNAIPTIARKMAVINTFFEFLVARGYMKDNPVKNISYGKIE